MRLVRHIFENPIRLFALVCVAATSMFFAYLLDWRLIPVLSGFEWCGKAMQAERIIPGNQFQGLTGCIDIMKMQIDALSKIALIVTATFALCLGVLVVIVIAGARLAGKVFGGEVDISRQDAGAPTPKEAAEQVANAAVDEAAAIPDKPADA